MKFIVTIICAALMFSLSTSSFAKEAPAPNYLTDEMLDGFVSGLRRQLPMTGPDGTRIISLSRQGRTLIYGMNSRDDITQQAADLMFSYSKIIVCRQEAEKFMLTRGVNLTWNYFNKTGKFLATTTLTPADCGYK